jgi:hypothetical protein
MLGSQFEFQFTYINNANAANAPDGCPVTDPQPIFTYHYPPGITDVTVLNSVGTLLELPTPPLSLCVLVWGGGSCLRTSRRLAESSHKFMRR